MLSWLACRASGARPIICSRWRWFGDGGPTAGVTRSSTSRYSIGSVTDQGARWRRRAGREAVPADPSTTAQSGRGGTRTEPSSPPTRCVMDAARSGARPSSGTVVNKPATDAPKELSPRAIARFGTTWCGGSWPSVR